MKRGPSNARARGPPQSPSRPKREQRFDADTSKIESSSLPRAFSRTAVATGKLQTGCPRRSERLQRRRESGASKDPLTGKLKSGASRESRLLSATRVGLSRAGLQQPTAAEKKRLKRAGKEAEPPAKPPAAASSRKRPLDGELDATRQLKRARLTKENLTLFNKMARRKGTKGTNSSSSSSHPESTTESTSTKTTSTTSSGFAIQAQKNGILYQVHSKPPKNLEDRRKGLARFRETASPPESAYERYTNTVLKACNGATMAFEVANQLLKTHDDTGYPRAFNQAFTAFPRDVGFNNGLSAPQPDFVEGLEIREYKPFPVNQQVSGAVLFRDDPFSVTLPHIAGEWKGRGKDMDEAKMQSAYDGAALTYARNRALAYLGNPDPPGHAEIATFTTDGTNINFFAHYAAASDDGVLEYHQYPIASTNLTSSFEEFKKGRRQLRNLQDDAKRLSYDLRDQLKDHWKRHRRPVSSLAPPCQGLHNVPEEPELEPEPQEVSAPLPPDAVYTFEFDDVTPAANFSTSDTNPFYDIVGNLPRVPLPQGSPRHAPRPKPSQRRRAASRPPPVHSSAKGAAKRRKSSSQRAVVDDG